MFKSLLLLLIATAANAIPIRYDNPSTGGISEVTADGRYWVRTGTAATGNYSLSGGSWSFVLGGSTFSVSCNGDRCFRVSGSGEITGNMIVGSTLTVQGNAFSVGGSTFVVVGGKVGIGVAAPTTPLDIQGGGSGMYFSTASNPSLGLYGSGGTVYIDGVDSGDNLNFVRHATLRNSAFNAARFYWTNTSNVEHGNIRLNTQGGLIIDTEEDTNGGNIWLRPNTGDGVSFGSGAAQSTFTAAGQLQLVAGSTITTNNGTLSFSTATSAALTTQSPIFITKDGRVGIGGNRFNVAPSGSPTAPDGNVLMMFGKGTDDGAMEAILFTGQGVGGPAGSGSFTTSEKIILYNTAGSKAAIFQPNDGAFGISGTGDANSFIGFYTANTSAAPPERMRIHSDGNVGISTNAPTSTLHVAGSAAFGSGATQSTFTASGFWEPISKTKAQIDALTPTKVGQIIYASDVTLPGLCVSTGTAVAQWRKIEGPAGLGCGTNN